MVMYFQQKYELFSIKWPVIGYIYHLYNNKIWFWTWICLYRYHGKSDKMGLYSLILAYYVKFVALSYETMCECQVYERELHILSWMVEFEIKRCNFQRSSLPSSKRFCANFNFNKFKIGEINYWWGCTFYQGSYFKASEKFHFYWSLEKWLNWWVSHK